MILNGIVVQGNRAWQNMCFEEYRGIMRFEAWPTWSESEFKDLNSYINYLYIGYYPEVISELGFAKKYVRECLKNNIKIRILAIESDSERPIWKAKKPEMHYLGYECASPIGDYFSHTGDDFNLCNLTDYPEYEKYKEKLNGYGLFDDIETLKDCMEVRERLFKKGELEYLCDYTEYIRVSEIEIMHLLAL